MKKLSKMLTSIFLIFLLCSNTCFAATAHYTEIGDVEYAEPPASTVPPKNNYTIRFVSSDFSNYPRVKLFYKIYDRKGNIVNDFKIKKVIIYERIEGGKYLMREVKRHEILSDVAGLNTSLVIDRSTSISSSNLKKIKNVLTQFIDNMNFDIGDKAEIISFGSDIKNVVKFTNNKNNLITGAKSIKTEGSTKLYDALYRGISHASSQNGARCVIGFTDGKDEKSTKNENTIINYSKKKQVPVYIVGAGNNIKKDSLKEIADKTGGKYWNINDLNDFYTKLKEIYVLEKSSYFFEYETDIPKDKGRYIRIKIDDGENIIEDETLVEPVIGSDGPDIEESREEDLSDSIGEKQPDINSWYKTKGGLWYYFENDVNTPAKGWFIDNSDNQSYYLDPETGVMAVGWTNIDGAWYYFNESHENEPNWYAVGNGYYESMGKKVKSYGSMFRDEITPDGKFVDATGKLIETTYTEKPTQPPIEESKEAPAEKPIAHIY